MLHLTLRLVGEALVGNDGQALPADLLAKFPSPGQPPSWFKGDDAADATQQTPVVDQTVGPSASGSRKCGDLNAACLLTLAVL